MPDVINDNGTWVIQPDVDLLDLNGVTIDITDGTWSHVDVGSQVKSFSHANGVNTVVLNAISSPA